ncbi:MAG: ribose-phosphate diphosphokinase [Armatimonadota bacterium]
MVTSNTPLLIVGTESDNPFAIDVALACGQVTDIADLISLKTFANSEFCPRFIEGDVEDVSAIGQQLAGATVAIVSTMSSVLSRNELALRSLLVARAAKDNGADRVLLVEPDLFFSAQDRGPRPEHGQVEFERDQHDFKKFNGQPFSSRLYAQMLALAGVDGVLTVHNHSASVQRLFSATMPWFFRNLIPTEVYADYIVHSDVTPGLRAGDGLLVCAPDKGARGFVDGIYGALAAEHQVGQLYIAKQRLGERNVTSFIDPASPCSLADVKGKDVVVLDDMVRTGTTIMQCCRLLKEAGAARVVFFVTHFYPSQEVRENLSSPYIDEIITTNTLPPVQNRDLQGRLRKKLTVLKIGRWMAHHVLCMLGKSAKRVHGPLYAVDMSSKNPRFETMVPGAIGHLKCEEGEMVAR